MPTQNTESETRMSSSNEVFSARDGLATGRAHQTCVAVWRSEPTAVRFGRQRSALEGMVRTYPGKTKFLCVIEPDTPPPSEAIRRAAGAMIDGHKENLGKVACVIEGTGFRAATTRVVLSGIAMLIRSSVPTKFFGTVESAARWLAAEDPAQVGQIAALSGELRARLDRNGASSAA